MISTYFSRVKLLGLYALLYAIMYASLKIKDMDQLERSKKLQILVSVWGWLITNDQNLIWIHMQTMLINNVS